MIKFFVAPSTIKLLLGTEALTALKLDILLSKKIIKSPNGEQPITTPEGKDITLRLNNSIVIPPRAEMCIKTHFKGPYVGPEASVLVSELPSFTSIPRAYYVARSISTISSLKGKNYVNVMICNASSHPILLQRNLGIASITLGSPDIVATITKEELTVVSGDDEIKKLMKDKVNKSTLSPEEQNQLEKLLQDNIHLFRKLDLNRDGPSKGTFCSIPTGDALPHKIYYGRKSQTEHNIAQDEADKLSQEGKTEPSFGPWASPIVLVRKKDGSIRFCIDFRKLNMKTKKDVYPLPRIDDFLDQVGGIKYISTLDLTSGYHQIPIRDEDKEKTAFATRKGLFQWKVMPMGLSNAPATFQRHMDIILSGLLPSIKALVYIDDIIILSPTFDRHLQDIQSVFDRLKSANMKIRLIKCNFCLEEMPYLGHVITPQGLKVDPSKVEAVKNARAPNNLNEVRRFLGMTGYYRRFIPNYSQVAKPLFELTKKTTSFLWNEACQKSFEALKQCLITAPVLAHPDFDQSFELHCDASNEAISAVLTQRDANGREHPVAYASRVLNAAEKNYSTSERECLAVIFFVKKFRPYLHGKQFEIFTDHSSLTWLMKSTHESPRLNRWALALQEYQFEIHYKKGKNNQNADSLTRPPFINTVQQQENLTATQKVIFKLQHNDEIIGPIINFLEKKIIPKDAELAKTVKTLAINMILEKGLLFRVTPEDKSGKYLRQLVIPKALVPDLLSQVHDSIFGAHLGFLKTYSKLKHKYWWPKMLNTVKNWVKSCPQCQTYKSRKLKVGLLQPISVDKKFQRWSLDIIGPLPTTRNGNKYILTFMEYLTRWPEAFPMKDATAITVAKIFLEEIISRFGAPAHLQSDRGAVFLGEVMDETTKLTSTKRLFTTAYHPQCNGAVEKFNGTLEKNARY